jgi:RNA polymerase sigma-70 factor (ECF subfamily)
LEEPYKEVFQLRVFGELSFRKIGQLFGKTENWARVTYHRARMKLQERMEQDESV